MKNIKFLMFCTFSITLLACNRINSSTSPQPATIFINQSQTVHSQEDYSDQQLREIYSQNPDLWPPAHLSPGVKYREIGTMPSVKFPVDNRYSKAKAELGKALFFDKRLSGSKELACASCHNPRLGWSDGKDRAQGHLGKQLKRNSPTIINAAYFDLQFWDGRAASLEEQARAVLLNPDEMHTSPAELENTLKQIPGYQTKFKEAFGSSSIKFDNAIKALATFERTVVTRNQSPFDRFLQGDKTVLSNQALRGMHLFRTRARCLNCHNGPNFTDNQFHNLSLTQFGTDMEDLGRYNITKKQSDWGLFKTPGLRNISQSAPYMHNGVFLNLKKVLSEYNKGMMGRDPNKSPLLENLALPDEDLEALEAFLNSLNEDIGI